MSTRNTVLIALGGLIIAATIKVARDSLERAKTHHRNSKKIDMASEDSFPASDPPSWTPVQSVRAAEA